MHIDGIEIKENNVTPEALQTVEQTNGFRQFDKSFGRALARVTFSKACAVKGAEPLSPLASGEISYTAFLFVSANSRSDLRRACEPLFICASGLKEKVAEEFYIVTNRIVFL